MTNQSLSAISKYRQQIYGFSILWIMLFHSKAIFGLNYISKTSPIYFIQQFLYLGNYGCDIFLFCSGICLYFSFYRNPDVMLFLKKRLVRILVPVILINSIYWGYLYLFKSLQILKFLNRILLTCFWITGDQQIWFVSLLLICYLLYPYLYFYFYEKEHTRTVYLMKTIVLIGIIALLTVILYKEDPELYKKVEIALTRIPVFILGCACGKMVYEKKTFSGYWLPVILILDMISFYILSRNLLQLQLYKRWYGIIFGVLLTLTIAGLFSIYENKLISRFLVLLGNMSLSLYLLHIMYGRVLVLFIPKKEVTITQYTILLLLCIPTGYLLEKLSNIIIKKIGRHF